MVISVFDAPEPPAPAEHEGKQKGEIFPKNEFHVKKHLNVTKRVLPMASRRRAAEQRRSYFTGLPGLLLFSGTRRRVLGGEQVNRRSDCSEADLLVRTGLLVLVLLRRGASRRSSLLPPTRPPAGRRRDTFTKPNLSSFFTGNMRFLWMSITQIWQDMRAKPGKIGKEPTAPKKRRHFEINFRDFLGKNV